MFCSALGAGALLAEAALLSQHLHPKEVVQESCSSGAVQGAALGTLEFFWHKLFLMLGSVSSALANTPRDMQALPPGILAMQYLSAS